MFTAGSAQSEQKKCTCIFANFQKIIQVQRYTDNDRSGYLKSDFRVPGISRKVGLLGKLNKAFLNFLPIFFTYLIIL